MAEAKPKIAPSVCAYADDNHIKLTIEIAIPGVSKADIKLKMHEDSMSLSAHGEDVEYATIVPFCCPVKPAEARARYHNGLLKIEVPFMEPMEDAIHVPVE